MMAGTLRKSVANMLYPCAGYGHITPKTTLGQGITILFCLLGIPITMVAMKSAGELWASAIRSLVIKTETGLLKRAEPKHVTKKTFFYACTLIVLLLILASVSTTSTDLENWNFMEGLYAWFITFTTIGFGDYVHLETLQRAVDQKKASNSTLILNGILISLPYLVGLSLMSCILSILMDSIDHIRDFRDRLLNCCPSLILLKQKLFLGTGSSNDPTNAAEENGQTEGQSQEAATTVV